MSDEEIERAANVIEGNLSPEDTDDVVYSEEDQLIRCLANPEIQGIASSFESFEDGNYDWSWKVDTRALMDEARERDLI